MRGNPIRPADWQRLRTGDRLAITETTYNAMVEVAQAAREGSLLQRDGDPLSSVSDANIVLVENNSGAAIAPFSPVGIDAPFFTDAQNLAEFQQFARFVVNTPALPGHLGRWCVVIDPIAAGEIGRAVVSGVVPVQIYLAAGAAPPAFADLIDGNSSYLAPGAGGSRVLWSNSGGVSPGPVWAIVRIACDTTIRSFELKTDLLPGQYAVAYPMKSDESDADTTATFVVYDQPEGNRQGFGRDTTGISMGAHGARGHAFYDAVSGNWQVLSIGTSIISFELKTDLAPGGSATAYFMKIDQSDANTTIGTISVYDQPEGNRHGFGRDTTGTSGGAHGARGHAFYDAASGNWQILSIGTSGSIYGGIGGRSSAMTVDGTIFCRSTLPTAVITDTPASGTITLPAGIWRIAANVTFQNTTVNPVSPSYDLDENSTPIITGYAALPAASGCYQPSLTVAIETIRSITASTTYKLVTNGLGGGVNVTAARLMAHNIG